MPPVVAAVVGVVAKIGVMQSLAYAGTAMSAVGAVTKNPKLMKIGAIVGGIGTLGGMGAFGAGAKTLGMSSAAKTAAASKAATAYGAGARESLSRQAISGTAERTLAPGAGVRAIGAGGGQLSQSAGLLGKVLPPGVAPNLLVDSARQAPTFMGKVGNALTATGKMIKDNPELATVIASGAGELANFLSGKTDAEIREMESRIDANDANAQETLFAISEEKRRRQNLNQGYLTVNPVISLPGQPNPYQPPGLLAQNMPKVTT